MLEEILKRCADEGVEVSIFLNNGIRLSGRVIKCENNGVWLDNSGSDCFVSLSSVSSVVPKGGKLFNSY
jgi:sRNA-binding regulator protein Hfq